MSDTAAIVGLAIVAGALLYLAYRIRALHLDLLPLINSNIVQTLAAA